MCDGHRHRRSGLLKVARDADATLSERVRGIALNLARRLRGGRVNDCCGNYGEPGC